MLNNRFGTKSLKLLFLYFFYFFFNDTATTEIYTLSLHDALPISAVHLSGSGVGRRCGEAHRRPRTRGHARGRRRSEEHTSELQSRRDLVCRLLLEKKKKSETSHHFITHKNITIIKY